MQRFDKGCKTHGVVQISVAVKPRELSSVNELNVMFHIYLHEIYLKENILL